MTHVIKPSGADEYEQCIHAEVGRDATTFFYEDRGQSGSLTIQNIHVRLLGRIAHAAADHIEHRIPPAIADALGIVDSLIQRHLDTRGEQMSDDVRDALERLRNHNLFVQ